MRTKCSGLTSPTITPSPSPGFFKATLYLVSAPCRGQVGVSPENPGQGSWVKVQASELCNPWPEWGKVECWPGHL